MHSNDISHKNHDAERPTPALAADDLKNLPGMCKSAAVMAGESEAWVALVEAGIDNELPPQLRALAHMGIKHEMGCSLKELRTELKEMIDFLDRMSGEAIPSLSAQLRTRYPQFQLLLSNLISLSQSLPEDTGEFGIDPDLMLRAAALKQTGLAHLQSLSQILDHLHTQLEN